MLAPTFKKRLASGLRSHQRGNLEDAAEAYAAVLDDDPLDADAWCLLGAVRREQGRPEEALGPIERAIEARPEIAAFHANHGLALFDLGRMGEAAEAFAKALERGPDEAAVHVNRGAALRALGDREGALVHFQRAVELDPKLVPALANLGALLTELGRAEQGARQCAEALRLGPESVEAHINMGHALRALGELEGALELYVEAMRLDPTRADAAAGVGLVAVGRGSLDEALDWLRRAVQLAPQSIVYWRYLAEAASQRGLWPEVRACAERILEIDPGHALAHNVLGYLAHDDGRLDEARRRYLRALEIDPNLAVAHHNLGVVCEEAGDLDEALERFRRALQLDPDHAMALTRLATLARGALRAEEIAAIRRKLDGPNLNAGDRANLLFGLAQVHDARGERAEAAALLAPANALAWSERAAQGASYDPAEHRRFVERAIAACTPEWFARLTGAGPNGPRPIIVCGLPRSGTTLVEQILASHPRVYAAGEVPVVRESWDEIPAVLGRSDAPLDCMADLTREAVAELARRHDRRLDELNSGRAERIVTKMPEAYHYLGLAALMFPGAVLVHCRRDPRDVAVSCWLTNFKDVPWANRFEDIAGRFAGHRRLMDHWRNTLPLSIHEVDYEETVADLESAVRRLLAACELDWDDRCLEFHRTRRPILTASSAQVRQPIYQRSVGRWKSYSPALDGLFALLGPGAAGARSVVRSTS